MSFEMECTSGRCGSTETTATTSRASSDKNAVTEFSSAIGKTPTFDSLFSDWNETNLFLPNTSTAATLEDVTNKEDQIEIYYFYKTEQLTFLWILFAMTVIGNSCVLVSLMMSSKRKSRMNFFIMHLAIADLTVGLINVLTDIIWRITVAFYGGNITCKFVKYMQVLVTYSSTYVLVALSIDRYDAITHPLNFSGSWRRARTLVASAWGLSAIFSLPAIFLNDENIVMGRAQCWIQLDPWEWQIYITMVAISLFFIPAIIIALCYSIIVHTIWNKSKVLGFTPVYKPSKSAKRGKRKLASEGVTNGGETANRASSRGLIPKAKIKTVKMTFVIVSVFILCWSPYFVYDLLQVYGYIPANQTSIAISTFIQSLAPLNSAANPFIYCLFSTQSCKNLRKLSFLAWIRKCCCPPCHNLVCRDTTVQHLDYSTMRETVSRSSARTTSSSVVSSSKTHRPWRSTSKRMHSKLSVTLDPVVQTTTLDIIESPTENKLKSSVSVNDEVSQE